jgi:hypothetical protein
LGTVQLSLYAKEKVAKRSAPRRGLLKKPSADYNWKCNREKKKDCMLTEV